MDDITAEELSDYIHGLWTQRHRLREREQIFIEDMHRKELKFGERLNLTDKQKRWIIDIYNRVEGD